MVLKLVFVLTIIVAKAWATLEDGQCCPPGQAILQRIRNPHYCWDPHTNATSFVTITCNETAMIAPTKGLDFYVNGDQLVLQVPNREEEYKPNEFCVGNWTGIWDVNLTAIRYVAVLCSGDFNVKMIEEEIGGYCMVVSCILLLITAFLYMAFSELRDLQGKSFIHLSLSLGIGLGLIAALKLHLPTDMGVAAAKGFFAYFFVMASFFWTNAISIQILFTMRRPTVLNYGWREFIFYAIYAWGVPAIMTIITAVINFAPGDHLKPGIGLNHYWFFNHKQQWRYMYSVMSILIAVNICIFIYTSIQLWRHTYSSSHIKALKVKFGMTLKLIVIMGLGWIFEMVSTIGNSHIIWEIIDLINCLQGVFISLVLVVFRKRVIKTMLKHGWLNCIAGPVEKCLAVGEDEEDVVQHTIGLSMDEPKPQAVT